MIVLYVDTDNLITVARLTDQATGQLVDAAAITVTVRDARLVAVAGGENLPLAPVDGSPGTYQGIVPCSLPLVAGESYFLDVLSVATHIRFDRLRAKAQYASGG
jgi:hypothetical protein